MLRLLLVEDSNSDIDTCKRAEEQYNEQTHISVEYVKNLSDALKVIDNTFDGVIIDLNLHSTAQMDNNGSLVIQGISDAKLRVPYVVLTGTPDSLDTVVPNHVRIYRKGSEGASYKELFQFFEKLKNTGITNIMGNKGEIETALYTVYNSNIIPNIGKWIEYGEVDSQKTEKALLRYTLAHLIHILDFEVDQYYPEEFYFNPIHNKDICTGEIISTMMDDVKKYFIVLSPACDLANGCRTTRYQLVEIEKMEDVIDQLNTARRASGKLVSGTYSEPSEIMVNWIKDLKKNNKGDHYHAVPEVDGFDLGLAVINFRHFQSVNIEELKHEGSCTYTREMVCVTPSFLKDIISRFSSYYARQGQPEIKH